MPKNVNLLIVEDEFLNRLYTKNTLAAFGYNNIYEASSVAEANNLLKTVKIDFAILDINLGPNKPDGLSLGNLIKKEYKIPFIYLTAYGTVQMLDKAKENEPSGFLVKPFTEVELLASIELAVDKSTGGNEPVENGEVLVKTGNKYVKLNVEDIEYVESSKNYLRIVSESQEFKCRSTLKGFLDNLKNTNFMQVHRAFVVNLSKVTQTDAEEVICGQHRIPVSRKHKEDVFRRLD